MVPVRERAGAFSISLKWPFLRISLLFCRRGRGACLAGYCSSTLGPRRGCVHFFLCLGGGSALEEKAYTGVDGGKHVHLFTAQ